MPQTRFVLDKALKLGLKPVVVLNKVDKPAARPDEVLNEIFDLFVELEASEDQLDFPVLYAAGRDGWAVKDLDVGPRNSILPLLDTIVDSIPGPPVREGALLRLEDGIQPAAPLSIPQTSDHEPEVSSSATSSPFPNAPILMPLGLL